MKSVVFRSELEKKWTKLFIWLRWSWTYSYNKGSPPGFWVTLPTDENVKVFVVVCHIDTNDARVRSLLEEHIAKIRSLDTVGSDIPILALANGPFYINHHKDECFDLYRSIKDHISPNCLGVIEHKCGDVRVCGTVTVRLSPKTGRYLMYWIDKDNVEYSTTRYENKPEGWYGKIVERFHWWSSSDRWSPIYFVGRPKSLSHTSSPRVHKIIDEFLYKPPRGLMFKRGVWQLEQEGLLRHDT